MEDRKILNTLEANDLLRAVNKHLDDPNIPEWKKLADYVMLMVEYVPELVALVEGSSMETLLWYRDGEATVGELITNAYEAFYARHKKKPNFITVHPSMLVPETHYMVNDVNVGASNAVLPNHVFLGIR